MASSSKQTPEASSNEFSKVEEEPLKAKGSYIAQRKRNIEYLDLETEDNVKTKRGQLHNPLTSLTTGELPPSNVPVDPGDLHVEQDDAPPGEEKFENQSFANQFSDMYSDDGNDSSSDLKRTIHEANLNNPENQYQWYLTLDEIEERKKARMEGGSITSKCASTISTGKFDARGRPIPGLATLPQDQQKQSTTHMRPPPSYDVQPQGGYQSPPLPLGFGQNSIHSKTDSAGKIYVGGMPPSLSEAHLHVYFSQFGTVLNVTLIRDRDTGISKGFGFVTFAREEEAGNVVTMMGNHIIERRPVRVSFASTQGQSQNNKKGKNNCSEVLDAMHLPEQARLYMGPLEGDVIANDVTKQFCQFGTVQLVQRIRASETTVKKSFGYVDYHEGSSAVCRAFGTRAFVKGRHVHLSLSKFAMELLLSDTCIFFYEAYEYCDEKRLEQHFSQFGQVYRALHIRNDPALTNSNDFFPWKNYGFIDFVSYESSVRALEMKTQLLHPGQYVRVGRTLPQILLFDLMAISDKYGAELKKRLEAHQAHGTWGDSKHIYGNVTTSQVRVPTSMVGKLIGERGKTIAEVTRDSKVKINIPKVDHSMKHVVISITGQKENIKTAQYLMQKLLKGQK